MTDFHFRLQKLQRLRRRERDQAADALQQAQLALTKLQDEVARLLLEHSQQRPVQSGALQEHVDPQRLLESQRFQMHLMQQVAQLRTQISMIQTEAGKRRQRLVHREQALQSLEKLEQHQRAEWDAAYRQRAQIALDEWAGFRYWKEHDQDKHSRRVDAEGEPPAH